MIIKLFKTCEVLCGVMDSNIKCLNYNLSWNKLLSQTVTSFKWGVYSLHNLSSILSFSVQGIRLPFLHHGVRMVLTHSILSGVQMEGLI